MGLIPGSGRFPGGGMAAGGSGCYLENAMGGGAWQATVRSISKSQTWLK